MERWLLGNDLMIRWGINFMELQSCILDDGLKPYDKNGKELEFRNRTDFTKTRQEYKPTWINERFPDTYPARPREKSITYSAGNIYFKLSDIEAFEKKHRIERQDLKLRQSTKDKKEVLKQARGFWGDEPETHENMAKTLHKFPPGSYYEEETIIKWLKEEKYGRGRGRPKIEQK